MAENDNRNANQLPVFYPEATAAVVVVICSTPQTENKNNTCLMISRIIKDNKIDLDF